MITQIKKSITKDSVIRCRGGPHLNLWQRQKDQISTLLIWIKRVMHLIDNSDLHKVRVVELGEGYRLQFFLHLWTGMGL